MMAIKQTALALVATEALRKRPWRMLIQHESHFATPPFTSSERMDDMMQVLHINIFSLVIYPRRQRAVHFTRGETRFCFANDCRWRLGRVSVILQPVFGTATLSRQAGRLRRSERRRENCGR